MAWLQRLKLMKGGGFLIQQNPIILMTRKFIFSELNWHCWMVIGRRPSDFYI